MGSKNLLLCMPKQTSSFTSLYVIKTSVVISLMIAKLSDYIILQSTYHQQQDVSHNMVIVYMQ